MSSPSWLPDGARLAFSLVVNVEEGAEQNIEDGDKRPEPVDELGIALGSPVRNLANESNYRYGIVEGAPRVLSVLDQARVRCTFTAAALSLARHPNLAREIVSRGHEVCSHGHRWVHQFSLDEERERAFIRDATETLEHVTGARPRGWLSRYLFTANTRRLLAEAGYDYHMDDYSADEPRLELVQTKSGEKAIAVVPYALDTNDMKLWTAPAYTPDQWLDYGVATFDELYAESADRARMMSVGVHLRIIGRPGRIHALRRLLAHVTSRPGVWVTSRAEIAARVLAR